ncbi:MAG: (Fe-S)-binding protein [Coriobacteriales bacterium]|jgi:Fe-S oxidoreductase|nr:(Fe-S)-binding protein [Coriobacteriales bacterium]
MGTKDYRLRQPQKLSQTELAGLQRLGSPLVSVLGAWLNKRLTCAHCKRCTRRCEVLEQPDLDIGLIEQHYNQVIELTTQARAEVVLQLVGEYPALYHALRQCCFCGHCTASCATHMAAPARMREWRELFVQAGLMPPGDSKLVMVDNEWHIFSAYRAIYGIAYPEFLSLADAAQVRAELGTEGASLAAAELGTEGDGSPVLRTEAFATSEALGNGRRESRPLPSPVLPPSAAPAADTLFFPGCSLVSYAPELLRRIGQWLTSAGFRWALSDACCGSPLLSAGLFERSVALRTALLEQIRAAGISRVLTVCPGCGEELAELMGDEVDIVPLPEVLADHVVEDPARFSPSTSPASLTFFDSCHDRFDTRHGSAVRRLLALCFPQTPQREAEHFGRDTLCCGAGGAVAGYDPEITQRRVWRVIDEARATGASTLVTTCPTCTYTIGQALLGAPAGRAVVMATAGGGERSGADTLAATNIASHNYLELVFDQTIDWSQVFGQLEAMWSGEYGPWLTETFF